MTDADISRQLARLTGVPPGTHRFVTCYLKLEPRDRTRGKYLIKLKNRIRVAEHSLDGQGLDRKVREGVKQDLDRITEYLRNPAQLPDARGVALFACSPLDIFEIVPLPLVYRSRLAVDRTPLVRELASVEDEFGRLLTVVFDRTAARFFLVTAFAATEVADLRAETTRGGKYHSDRQGAPGRGEQTYHNRIREEKQRHYEQVARRLFELNRSDPVQGIVLCGGAEAGALEPFLHPYVAERLMGIARLNPKEVTAATVRETTLAVRESYEREAERELGHEMKEGLGSGWAVNGTEPTLRALSRGQVRTLLVDADAGGPGFRCSESGRLTPAERDCRAEGAPVPVLDIVDEAIEEALRQRVTVDVVYDPEACRALDGLAGLLRFR